MEFSTVALFWRDLQACYFTYCRFFSPDDPLERAKRIAFSIEQLSTIQIYCVIANLEILPWKPLRAAPPAGTQQRLEISLYPSEPLNPRAGITTLKITIPGPNKVISEFFTSSTANFSHPTWQMLEKEVIPYLRLPNGLPVTPALGAARIQRVALVEIAEEYRHQAGQPPVDAAISGTVQRLDSARSRLARAQRANQPFEFELAAVEKYQHQLEYLKTLHNLEQSVWQSQYANSSRDEEDLLALPPLRELSPIIDKTGYLPVVPDIISPEWSDIHPADFSNPLLWAQLGQLKDKFKITSRRTFWRAIARLREMGLRTLQARQDGRIKLFFRPDLTRILADAASKQSPKTTSQLDQIWQAIYQLQSQQQDIINSQSRPSTPTSKGKPTSA